jgi:proteasome activator subunit 4
VPSGYQGLVPSNPHMTSGFRPYLLLAFLDSVNRVGTTVCRWLFQTVHDTNAISAFDYILPLMVRRKPIYAGFKPFISLSQPELFRFTEGIPYMFSVTCLNFSFSVNDNDELLSRARMLLVRMCGVTPPRPLIGPILTAIFDTILTSPV